MTSTDALIDALPYADEGYDTPGVREAAASLIEEEVRFAFLATLMSKY